MPTIIRTLKEADPKLWQQLYEACLSMYLDGECYAFATALHEGLGWNIYGLMQRETVRHVVVKNPDIGRFFDARGFWMYSKSEMGGPFQMTDFEIHAIDVQDLVMPGESPEARSNSVARARMLAETLWPELSWKESFASRMNVFADELEALSRKHGVWVRASLPAIPPSLAVEEGGEGGYTICAGFTGAFTLNRYLLHK